MGVPEATIVSCQILAPGSVMLGSGVQGSLVGANRTRHESAPPFPTKNEAPLRFTGEFIPQPWPTGRCCLVKCAAREAPSR